MVESETIRRLDRRGRLYHQGFSCLMELLAQVVVLIGVRDAGRLLDELDPEWQQVPRQAFAYRPGSLSGLRCDGEVRSAVESWCRKSVG